MILQFFLPSEFIFYFLLFIIRVYFIFFMPYEKYIFDNLTWIYMEFKDEFSKIFDEMDLNFGIIQGYHTRKHSD